MNVPKAKSLLYIVKWGMKVSHSFRLHSLVHGLVGMHKLFVMDSFNFPSTKICMYVLLTNYYNLQIIRAQENLEVSLWYNSEYPPKSYENLNFP